MWRLLGTRMGKNKTPQNGCKYVLRGVSFIHLLITLNNPDRPVYNNDLSKENGASSGSFPVWCKSGVKPRKHLNIKRSKIVDITGVFEVRGVHPMLLSTNE